jgi:tetratricopeptide (TPR) repeat protein
MKTPLTVFGCALAAVGLVLKWLNNSITHAITALNFPLFGGIEQRPKFVVASYGVMIALLLAAGLAAHLLRRPRAFCFAAAAALAITLFAPLHLAFANPARMRSLIIEHDQYRKIYGFANIELPLNRGVEPTFDPNLDLTTVWDRFQAARDFLTLGWSLIATGAAISFAMALLALRSRRERWLVIGTFAAVAVCACAITAAQPVLAEWNFHRALLHDARGDLAEARACYSAAIAHDAWYRLGPYAYRQIGEIDAKFGRRDTAEFHLYQGSLAENQNLFPQAIFEYQRAAALGGFARVAHQEAARTAALYAAQLYAQGAIGEAIASWELALREDDRQLLALFCIARGYHALAQYPKSIETNLHFMKLCANPLILANVHSNLGDAYEKLGQFPEARRHYAIAQKLDNDRNFRAYNSLAGQ